MKRKFLKFFLALLSAVMVFCTVTACENKKENTQNDQPICAVKLDKTAATMDLYETLTLTATLENLTGNVVWSTSDQAKATVKDGVVTSLSEGEVTIGAAVGEVSANCVITIQSSGEIPALNVNTEIISLRQSEEFTLVPSLKYKGNKVNATFSYRVAEPTIATVENGKITAKECGETQIFVSASYFNFETTKAIPVKVTADVGVELNADKITLGTCALGGYQTEKTVAATVYKNKAPVENPAITWSTDKADIATVSGGVITAIGVGEATITATYVYSENESFESVVKVTVEKPVLDGTLTNGVLDIDADDTEKVSLSLDGLDSYAAVDDLLKIVNKSANDSELSFEAGEGSVALNKDSLEAGKYDFRLEFKKIIYNVNVKVTADVIDVLSFNNKDDADRAGVYWSIALEKSYTEDRAYGSEKGSLKFTVKKESCPNYISVYNPLNKDVSDYDYLVWRVYNDTEKTLKIGTTWQGDTVCVPKKWTEVIIWSYMFAGGSVQDMSGNKLSTTDITNFVIRLINDGSEGNESLSVNDTFYVSAIQGVKHKKSAAENVAVDFTEDFDLKRVVSGEYQLSLNTDKAYVYGEETGSLKVKNAGASATGDTAITLKNALHSDMSAYDYVVFYVYNATQNKIQAGTWWCADTWCEPGEWTAVKITKGMKSSFSGFTFENINEFKFRIINGLPAGGEIYISALKGVKIEGNVGVEFKTAADLSRVSAASGCELSIDTEHKYGTESGSLKVKNVGETDLGDTYYAVQIKDAYKPDLSEFDYIVFYVYNATENDINVGTLWCADTICKSGEWTAVKITKDMNLTGCSFGDINGMAIRLISGLPAGGEIYISAITGGYNAE